MSSYLPSPQQILKRLSLRPFGFVLFEQQKGPESLTEFYEECERIGISFLGFGPWTLLYLDSPWSNVHRHQHELIFVCGTLLENKRDFQGTLNLEADNTSTLLCAVKVSISRSKIAVEPDPSGRHRVFYTSSQDFGLVCSNFLEICSDFSRASLSEAWLSFALSSPQCLASIRKETPYLNVFELSPFETFHKEMNSRFALERRTILDFSSHDRLPLDEAAQQLQNALRTSVHERVRRAHGKVSCDFSGGIDSSSVAYLCAEVAPSRVPVISSWDEDNESPHDDQVIVSEVLADENRFHLNWFSTQNTVPLSAVETLSQLDYPTVGSFQLGTFQEKVGLIQRMGTNLHFSGEGADGLISAHLSVVPQLFLEGRIQESWLTLQRAKARNSFRWSQVLQGLDATRSFEKWKGTVLHRYARGACNLQLGVHWDWLPVFSAPMGALSKKTAECARQTFAEANFHNTYTSSAFDFQFIQNWWGVAQYVRWNSDVTFAIGKVMHDSPYLDASLWKIGARVDPTLRFGIGKEKRLLMAATKGLLPDRILNRNTRHIPHGFIAKRMRSLIPDLRSRMANGFLVRHGFLDRQSIDQLFLRLAAGDFVNYAFINAIVGMEMWYGARE